MTETICPHIDSCTHKIGFGDYELGCLNTTGIVWDLKDFNDCKNHECGNLDSAGDEEMERLGLIDFPRVHKEKRK